MSANKTWAERLRAAKVRGKFTPYEKRLAANFHTCAVGEAYVPASARTDHDAALHFVRPNAYLLDLGCEFVRAVMGNEIPEAWSIYLAIRFEARRAKAESK